MIISIEDGTLHPDLPFLAWLMIALSKNFVASNLIKEEVCRIAGELAAQEFRDDGNDFDFVVDEKDGEKEDDDVGVVDDVLPPLSAIQEKFGSNSEETHLISSHRATLCKEGREDAQEIYPRLDAKIRNGALLIKSKATVREWIEDSQRNIRNFL